MRPRRTAVTGRAIVALLVVGVATLGAGTAGWGRDVASSQRTLPADVEDVLLDALLGPNGEYVAYATYAAIIDAHGAVRPFISILASEARHIEALQQILDRYGIPYPRENPYLETVEAPDSLLAAVQAGADAEIANIALYERQLEAVAKYADILEVLVNLRAASQQNHLPAFQRAAIRLAG